jgi:hypothetical protein
MPVSLSTKQFKNIRYIIFSNSKKLYQYSWLKIIFSYLLALKEGSCIFLTIYVQYCTHCYMGGGNNNTNAKFGPVRRENRRIALLAIL